MWLHIHCMKHREAWLIASIFFFSSSSNHILMLLFVCLIFSDGTLNPNGVRFGSSEIYNIGMILTSHLFQL